MTYPSRGAVVQYIGVDLILFEGTGYLVVEIQMELLEICSNLVSSFRHNRFEGHFKFGVEALVRVTVTIRSPC